jgi:hypothetical protein
MRLTFSFVVAACLIALFALKADKCSTTVNAPDTQKEEPNKEGS